MTKAEEKALEEFPNRQDWERTLYATGYARAEKDYKELIEMCYDTISEYKNGSLGDSTINELARVLNNYPKPY